MLGIIFASYSCTALRRANPRAPGVAARMLRLHEKNARAAPIAPA
ncbi:MAG: hypothetical protein U1F43_38795 [Myxococcota bacterium]